MAIIDLQDRIISQSETPKLHEIVFCFRNYFSQYFLAEVLDDGKSASIIGF